MPDDSFNFVCRLFLISFGFRPLSSADAISVYEEPLCVTNARIICQSKNGHCYIWTIAEGNDGWYTDALPGRISWMTSAQKLFVLMASSNLTTAFPSRSSYWTATAQAPLSDIS